MKRAPGWLAPLRRREGFSLIELVVVMGILTLLALLAVGGGRWAFDAGRAAVCQNNLRQLVEANWAYAGDHGTFVAAASDINEANACRWHGVRGADGAFDAAGGPLTGYLGGAGVSGIVRACPAFRPAAWGFEASCGGYGYNAQGIGSLACMPPPNAGTAKGVPPAVLTHPATTVMFADAAYLQGSGAKARLIEYSFCEPRTWSVGGTPWPTIHFRHRGRANVAWCDGHVTAELRTATGARGAEAGLGWFGPEAADLFSP
ncbi:MAG: prepilin-type N-terminal cleavage/methylation domain-containing protein [Kiritimatiellae bacterium]|nr:prepilin-type N-terminal cleavage/methylation domain-containing protein [Kiritimatiellia bacterium]